MNMEKAALIVERPHKKVYKCEKDIVKVFNPNHPKADVFNEALNTARVEAAGLDIPKVKEVTEIDGRWSNAGRDDARRRRQSGEIYGGFCGSSAGDAQQEGASPQ